MSRILIVDDSPVNLKIIGSLLDDSHDVITALDGQTAIRQAAENAPDLILLDVLMPGMDGLEVCRILKSQQATAEIPVIFITVVSKPRDIVKALEAGGQDYITKPFCALELRARIKAHLELRESREALKAYARELEAKNRELNETLARLEVVAMTDYLTGLPNRRFMMQRFTEEIARVKRTHGQMALVLADVDKFKAINDTYGHNCGDLVLERIAAVMRENLREQDIVARWGGEEFLFLLPDTDFAGGQVVAEKLSRAILAEAISYGDRQLSVNVTFGVAQYDCASDIDANIKKADEALYLARKHSLAGGGE